MTIVTTLWYTGSMVIRHAQQLKHLLKSITIFIIVMGIAGLGTPAAGQITCEPDCSVHAQKLYQASCCVTPGTSHAKLLPGDVQENHHPPLSDCNGTFCIDSSLEVLEIALNVFNAPDTPTAVSRLSHLPETNVLHTVQRSSGGRYYTEKTIPIYILTCVYLI